MRSTVTFLRRRGGATVEGRRLSLTEDTIRIGRGTESEIHLSDPQIRLDHAVIRHHGDVIILEALTDAAFTSENRIERLVQLSPGVSIRIGPFELAVAEPGEDDLAITVEMVQARGDTLQRITRDSITSLQETWLNTRATAWCLVLAILAGFLAWPILENLESTKDRSNSMMASTQDAAAPAWIAAPDQLWLSGEISDQHKFFAEDCVTCHREPFRQVADSACTACHDDAWHHADPSRVSMPLLSEQACQACHKEHTGPRAIVRRDEAFCGDCHRNLRALVADTELLNVSSFGSDHPGFRPAVTIDPGKRLRRRMALKGDERPRELSGLIFPHNKHLKPDGLAVPHQRAKRVLTCANCHRLEKGGIGMEPISMNRDCRECHPLRFEPRDKVRALPHGDLATARTMIQEYYGNQALQGGVADPAAPPVVRRRRLPGQTVSATDRRDAIAWAESKIKLAEKFAFGRSGCGLCHTIKRSDDEAGWRIEPVFIVDRWLPKGLFNHAAHRTTTCSDCHSAKASSEAADVLLPKIETCRNCHGGEHARARLPSTCVTCHDFHIVRQAAMGRPAIATGATRRLRQ